MSQKINLFTRLKWFFIGVPILNVNTEGIKNKDVKLQITFANHDIEIYYGYGTVWYYPNGKRCETFKESDIVEIIKYWEITNNINLNT